MKKVSIWGIVLAFLTVSVVPALAETSFDFYGSARFETMRLENSKETNNLNYITPGPGSILGKAASANHDDSDTVWDFERATSRFGMRANAGNVSANVALRPNTSSVVRHWNATWDFGPGKVLIGQWWSPLFIIGQYNQTLFKGGGLHNYYGYDPNGCREEMIELMYPSKELGMFTIAFIKPPVGSVTGLAGTENDTTFPKVEATFKSRPIGPFTFGICQ